MERSGREDTRGGRDVNGAPRKSLPAHPERRLTFKSRRATGNSGTMLAASHLSNDNGKFTTDPPPTLSTAAAADGVAMTAVRVRDSTATAIGVGGLAQVAGEGASRPR